MNSPYDDLDRPPLDAAILQHALVTEGSLWREVSVVEETASTNTDLADLAREGAPGGVVLVAEHQTAGRGRLERNWVTPARSALTFSMLVRPAGLPAARWPWLPLLTGVAVCEAVRRAADLNVTVKWPNDIVLEDRKLAGILSERVDTAASSAGAAGDDDPAAVIGIGLNVSMREDELPVPDATSLAIAGGKTADRTVVLREVLRVFEQLYDSWLSSQGDPEHGLAASYSERCSTLGQAVRAEMPSGLPIEGRAVRIDGDGRLVIDTGADETAVGAGDVVHLH